MSYLPWKLVHVLSAILFVGGLVVNGVALIGDWRLPGTGWLFCGIVLFVISGAAFGLRVAPLQREPVRLAAQADCDNEAKATLHPCYRSWQIRGIVAVLTPLMAVALMVLRPSLPALQG